MRTSVGIGRAVAAQSDIFSAPLAAYANPGTIPGVVWLNGYNGAAAIDALSTSSVLRPMLWDLVRSKYCVASGDFGLTLWGSPTAVGYIDTIRTWMQATMGARSGKVALFGVSMGSLAALNYAKAHPAAVSCVACLLPVCNTADMVTNNRGGYAASINAAYGTYNDGTMGATSNPGDFAATLNVPVRMWYGTADTICVPSTVTNFLGACPTATGKVIDTTHDHTTALADAVPVNDVMSFLSTYNS